MKSVADVLEHLRDSTTVRFESGTYFFSKPIVIPSDLNSLTLESNAGQQAVISAGQRITGWRTAKLNGLDCWSAYLPAVRLGLWDFRELWVDGVRAQRARYPALGYLVSVEPVDGKAPWNQGQMWLGYKPGDLPDELPREAEVIIMNRWEESRLPVASIDAASHRINSSRKTVFQLENGDPYFLEGASQWLTKPGEWYLDHHAGVLYYLPRSGEKMNAIEAIAPTHDQILKINSATNLTIRSLAFSHSEWNFPNPVAGQEPIVGGFGQAAMGVTSAVLFENCHGCTIQACRFEHLGNYAMELGRGCQQNKIEHCTFTDLGAGAIKIGDGEIRNELAGQAFGNGVSDCIITECGRLFPSACGIWVGQSSDNQILHNEISNLYYTAISLGWTWGYGPSLSTGNRVEANLIHHIGKKFDGDGPILSDMGAVYTLGARPGTVISGNVFHDIAGRVYGGWGVYLDEGSSGLLIEKNLIYRTTHGGFHLHYGKDNLVQNNIFALGRDVQIARSQVDPGINFTFRHNIIYWNSGVFTQSSHDDLVADENLYQCFGNGKLLFGDNSWEQWNIAGRDTHSILGNAGFVDPEKGYFQLKANAPALKIGFEPLDLKDVGPRVR